MGVLGWTYDQTLDTPMPAIAAALGARTKFVNSVLIAAFGSEDDPSTSAVANRKPTMDLFDALFAGGSK